LANKAAVKAVVVNRIGDVFMLTGLALIFAMTRSLDFAIVFPVVDYTLMHD
jgi:NADH:ubiquinone oxidoreductase subunit 5 (subunit L)/multisubunit Na+/H+ antiporter MnhA subunit